MKDYFYNVIASTAKQSHPLQESACRRKERLLRRPAHAELLAKTGIFILL